MFASAGRYWESKGMESAIDYDELRRIAARAWARGDIYRKPTHNYHLCGRPTKPIDPKRKAWQLKTGAKWADIRKQTGVSRQRLAKKLEIGLNMMVAFEVGDRPISDESFDIVLAKVKKFFSDCYGNLSE
jgi:hypothetical protein